MKPVATRSIRKTSEKAYTGMVTIKMDDPRPNYFHDIGLILEKIFRDQLVTLRILINKTIYGSSFGKIGFKDKTLYIRELIQGPGSLEYIISYPGIVFRRSCYHDKYDIYRCSLDETLLQHPIY